MKSISNNYYRSELSKCFSSIGAGNFLFYSAFFAYAIGQMIISYSAVNYMGYEVVQALCFYLKLAAAFLLVMKLALFQRYTVDQMCIVASLCLLGLSTFAVSGNMSFFFICLFIASGKGVDYRTVAALALGSSLFVIAFCVIGYLAGLLPDRYILRGETLQLRHSFGFFHPNSFGLVVSEVCFCLLVLRFRRLGIFEALICFASILLIDIVSDSRTSMLSIALAFVLFFGFSRLPEGRIGKALGIGLTVSVAVLVVLSVWFMMNYDPSRFLDFFINDLVDDRPRRSNWYFTLYPPGVFGQDVSLLPEVFSSGRNASGVFNVDNSYAFLYLQYGPLAFIVIIAMLMSFLVTSCRRRDWGPLFVGLVLTAIYGFSESYFNNLEFNYYLLALSWLIYGFPVRETNLNESKLFVRCSGIQEIESMNCAADNLQNSRSIIQ